METSKSLAFEEFLKEQHAKDYHGTDDDMPDAYEAWLEQLGLDEIIQFADDALLEAYGRGMHRCCDIALELV
jgi:hypothetical protein